MIDIKERAPKGAFVPNRSLEGQLGNPAIYNKGGCVYEKSLWGPVSSENRCPGKRGLPAEKSLRNGPSLYGKGKEAVLAPERQVWPGSRGPWEPGGQGSRGPASAPAHLLRPRCETPTSGGCPELEKPDQLGLRHFPS